MSAPNWSLVTKAVNSNSFDGTVVQMTYYQGCPRLAFLGTKNETTREIQGATYLRDFAHWILDCLNNPPGSPPPLPQSEHHKHHKMCDLVWNDGACSCYTLIQYALGAASSLTEIDDLILQCHIIQAIKRTRERTNLNLWVAKTFVTQRRDEFNQHLGSTTP